MGKSGKKVKSDKINALRKQYDAFLEDDKKRKDRNEYILGRLENVRSSTALIRIRHKENSYITENYLPSQRIPMINKYNGVDDNLKDLPTKTNIGVNCLPKQFESSILKEISKNYILIPKVQSCVLNGLSYAKPSIDDVDTDWKSKYNILNELKKNEKESISDEVNDIKFTQNPQTVLPGQESLSNKQDDTIKENMHLIDNSDDTYKNPNDKLEPNMPNLNSITSNKTIEDNFDASPDYKKSIKNEDSNKPSFIQREVEIPNKCVSFSTELNHQNPITNTYKIETDYNELHNESTFEESSNVNHIPQDIENIKTKIPEKQQEEPIDTDNFLNARPIHQNTEEDLEVSNAISYEKNDGLMLTNKDNIQISEDQQENFKGKVNENEVEVNDIQNYISHEGPMVQDKIANEEISDLEKEQNEMFYTEKSDIDYEYDQSNINTSEYPAENENYTNDQYSYYEETQQQQPYVSEVNEHEESTERYDSSYEQQYNGDYGNVVNQLQYENQQYEIENSFEIQQEPIVQSDEQQPANETLEQLDYTNVHYQNQQDPVNCNYEIQAPTNENYDSQQYVHNEQQDYATPALSEEDQYAAQQEYTQMHNEQENIIDMEKQLDTEDGYIVDETTTCKDIADASIADNDSPVKTESTLEAS